MVLWKCGPWQQTECVPDISGSCQSRVWLGAFARSARTAQSAAPSPSAGPWSCGHLRAGFRLDGRMVNTHTGPLLFQLHS